MAWCTKPDQLSELEMSDPFSINLLIGAAATGSNSSCEGIFTSDPWFIQMFGTDDNGEYTYLSAGAQSLQLQAYPRDMVVDNLGNIYVVGNQKALNGMDWQSLIWKYSSDGRLLWWKTLGFEIPDPNNPGSNYSSWDLAKSVAVADDGGVFVVGTTDEIISTGPGQTTTRDRPYIVKYDCSGTLLWQKAFNHSADSMQGARFQACRVSGNYLYTMAGPYFDTYQETFFHKFDLDGNLIWSNSYTTTQTNGYLWTNNMEVDSTGSLVATVNLNSATNNNNSQSIGTIKLDTAGNLSWFHVLNVGFIDSDEDGVAIAPDGSIYRISTDHSQNIYVIKLSSAGVLQWQRSLTQGGNTDTGGTWNYQTWYPNITTDETGNVIVSFYSDRFSTSAGQFLKIDPAGNIIWQTTLDTGGGDDDNWYSYGAMTHRNGMLYFTTGDMSDMWNRYHYVGIAKLPTTPISNNTSFGGQVSYYTNSEPDYVVKSADPGFIVDSDPITNYGLITTTHTLVPGTATLTEDPSWAWAASPTLLPLDPLPTTTGQHWISNYAEQGLANYGAEIQFWNCIIDNLGSPIVAGFTYPVQGFSWNGNPPNLVKYTPTGDIVWAKYINIQNFSNQDSHLAVDSSNNIYHIFDDGSQSLLYIFKHDTDGNLVWQKQITGANNFTVRGAKFLAGNILVYGNHYYPNSPQAAQQAFLMAISPAGDLVNQIEWGGDGANYNDRSPTDECFGVVQASDSNLIITGETNPNLTAQADQVIAKLDSSWSSFIWQRRLGTDLAADFSSFGNDIPYNLHQDGAGNLYTFGVTTAGAGPSTSAYRLMLSKYDPAGNFQWMRQWHPPGFASLGDWEGRRSVMVGNYIYAIWSHQSASPLKSHARQAMVCISKFDLTGAHINTFAMVPNGEENLFPYGITSDGTNHYIAIAESGDCFAGVFLKIPLDGFPDGFHGRYMYKTITLTESILSPHEVAGAMVGPTTTSWTLVDLGFTVADAPIFLSAFKQILD